MRKRRRPAAIILARGMGTRMRRRDDSTTLTEAQKVMAETGLKAMIPVGRPFLDYVLSALADAGVRDVCLVLGPEHDAVREYYTTQVTMTRLRLAFAVQHEAHGTADALLSARSFAEARPCFLVLNADNYYPVECYQALLRVPAPGLIGFDRDALVRLGNVDSERIKHYALVRVDGNGFLEDIVEKPDRETFARMEKHALVSMNLWSFTKDILTACERVPPSPRGELELPQAVRYAMREGARFRVMPFATGVLDLSHRRDVATVARKLRRVHAVL